MKLKLLLKNNQKFYLGFTLVESLISLSIISIISIVITAGILLSMQSYRKSSDQVKNAYKLLEIDRQIRNICSNIEIPFWETNAEITFTEHTFSTKWYKSKDNLETFEFPDIIITKIEQIQSKKNKLYGLIIYYSFNEKPHICKSLLKNIPYGELEL